MTKAEPIRNKTIIFVYKSLFDGTFISEALKGRTEEDFLLISNAMLRGFDKDPNIYLHRTGVNGMEVTSIAIRKNYGNDNVRTLYQLVSVEFKVDKEL